MAALWLFDAVLQYQSFMFGAGFARMLADAAVGNPAPVAGPVIWSARLVGQHAGAANAAFATLQLMIGLGIAWRPTVKVALAGSIVWALGVWWLGEGLGGVLTPAANPVTGAPGAALLYALLAVLLWPRRRRPVGFAAGGAVGPGAARAIWILLWGSLAWLAVANAPAAVLPAFGSGPGPLVLAGVFCLIAAGIMLPAPGARCVIVAAVVAALVMWSAGQDFGGLLTGMATDPNTGPLLALFAAAFWPARAARDRRAEVRAADHAAVRSLAPAQRDVIVMQVLMGAATAGMLVPRLELLPATAWRILAAAGLAWFGWRLLAEAISASRPGAGAVSAGGSGDVPADCSGAVSAGGSGDVPAGGFPNGAGGRHLPHILACGAMMFMLLAPPGMELAARPGGIAAAAGGMPGTAGQSTPLLALGLAVALVISAVLTTDRLTAGAPGRVAAGVFSGAGAVLPRRVAGAARSGRVAACCQVAMGIIMAYLLVQML